MGSKRAIEELKDLSPSDLCEVYEAVKKKLKRMTVDHGVTLILMECGEGGQARRVANINSKSFPVTDFHILQNAGKWWIDLFPNEFDAGLASIFHRYFVNDSTGSGIKIEIKYPEHTYFLVNPSYKF